MLTTTVLLPKVRGPGWTNLLLKRRSINFKDIFDRCAFLLQCCCYYYCYYYYYYYYYYYHYYYYYYY